MITRDANLSEVAAYLKTEGCRRRSGLAWDAPNLQLRSAVLGSVSPKSTITGWSCACSLAPEKTSAQARIWTASSEGRSQTEGNAILVRIGFLLVLVRAALSLIA